MPSPKSGTAGTIVPPAAPTEAKDADNADPGQVEKVKASERQTKTGKYGSTPVKPYKGAPQSGAAAGGTATSGGGQSSEEQSKETKVSWIEFELRDKRSNPVAGAKYIVKLADGTQSEGTLDDKGCARLDPIPPGNCQISFPEYAPNSWEPA